MSLNFDSIGVRHGPIKFSYTSNDLVLYALSVGADQNSLNLIYEGDFDFAALPTFAVVPITSLMFDAITALNADLTRLLHGEQENVIHRPLPTEADLETYWWVDGIYDKGKGALAVLKSETHDKKGLLFENIVGMFLRGAGGFGGNRGPQTKDYTPPTGKSPDFEVKTPTLPYQSYLYRLNGDMNPLHASPQFAQMAGFERPILHGLGTYGFATRAFITAVNDGDPTKVKHVATRFSGVVYPGDTIITRGWQVDNKKWVLTSETDRNVKVLSNFVIETR